MPLRRDVRKIVGLAMTQSRFRLLASHQPIALATRFGCGIQYRFDILQQ
jgi:hypothetical protein